MLDLLYEDNHCLAVNKPAGLLTQGDATGEPSLLEAVRADLKARYQKPGNVFVGLVHRLDRPTSGVVLFARTSKGAARLSAQFRAGTVEKLYWAIVEGVCPVDSGRVDRLALEGRASGTWCRSCRRRRRVRGRPGSGSGSSNAAGGTTTLELRPLTGRSHQLRVQLGSRGLPILGDRKYGGKARLLALDGQPRVALHARRITFTHPTRPEVIEVVAEVSADWPASGRGTG